MCNSTGSPKVKVINHLERAWHCVQMNMSKGRLPLDTWTSMMSKLAVYTQRNVQEKRKNNQLIPKSISRSRPSLQSELGMHPSKQLP